jgi:Ni/Co efflux regulator RcnB
VAKKLFVLFALVFAFAGFSDASAMSSTGEAASASESALGFSKDEARIIREVLGAVKRAQGEDGDEDHKGGHKGHKDKGKKAKGMPPGLAKRDGDLPPGLERHIEKHGTLPPGLEGRDFPDDLKRRLGKTRKGTKRILVGDDAVLIEEATGVVLDVLKDVFGD